MEDVSKDIADQATIVKTTALFVAIVAAFATIVRALVAREIDMGAVPTTMGCVAMLVMVNRYVHRGGSAVIGAWWTLAIIMCIYMYLSISSHGLSGSIVYAAPLVPMLTWVLLDRAATRIMTVITGVFVMFVMSQHLAGNLVAEADFPQEVRFVMKAVVMLLSLIAIYWVISFKSAERSSQQITTRADESRDELTGLYARSALDDSLKRELIRTHRSARPLSLVVADIDGFDQLIEEIGSAGADKALAGVSDGLQYCMRRSADYLGRYSRSRFAILMPDTGSAGASKVAEKFRGFMESLDIPLEGKDTVRMAVTVASCTVSGAMMQSGESLYMEIESALTEGQAEGGNTVVLRELA